MLDMRRRWPARTSISAVTAATGLSFLVAAAMMRDRSMPTDFGATWTPTAVAGTPSSVGAALDPASPGAVAGTPSPPAAGTMGAALDPLSHRLSAPMRPAVTPIEVAAPSQVTIPKLGVRADVQPVLTSKGELEVPADPARLGWWTGSARVGATSGTVVIDGHLDSAATGPGALFRLTDLHAADRIVITTVDGRRQDYGVIGRRAYVKANGLPAELFTTSGPPRLMLITCGGQFDRTTRSYLDNIVIFAIPIADREATRR